MVWILFLGFTGVMALAITNAVIRRKLNPYLEVAYPELPSELRSELERVLPGYRSELSRITKKGDEARIKGEYRGAVMNVEADFDPAGRLVDLEIEGPPAHRKSSSTTSNELPEAAAREVERVLGDAVGEFERRALMSGTTDQESYFKVKGAAGEWKWEISVTSNGQLLEVERERRRQG